MARFLHAWPCSYHIACPVCEMNFKPCLCLCLCRRAIPVILCVPSCRFLSLLSFPFIPFPFPFPFPEWSPAVSPPIPIQCRMPCRSYPRIQPIQSVRSPISQCQPNLYHHHLIIIISHYHAVADLTACPDTSPACDDSLLIFSARFSSCLFSVSLLSFFLFLFRTHECPSSMRSSCLLFESCT